MNYKELREWLYSLTEEQLEQDVTYYDNASDTYSKVSSLGVQDDDVVQNQPVLIVNDEVDLLNNEYPNQKRVY